MTDYLLVVLCVSLSIVNAFEIPTLNPKCTLNEDPLLANNYLPHSYDCDKFYKCINGTSYPTACLQGMHWNQSLKKCEDSDVNFTCQLAETTPADDLLLCPADEDPLKISHLPNSNDCEQFYACLGGQAHPMTCRDGLHWSVELNGCENPSIAKCQQRQVRSVFADGDINPDCPLEDDPSNPTILRYPLDCAKFYKCAYGRSYVLSCPFGLHWDVASNRCESPFVAKCKNGGTATTASTTKATPATPSTVRTSSSSTTTTTTTTTTRPDPILPDPIPECSDLNSVQKFGIPGECQWFVQCYQGQAFRIKCRDGREWSSTIGDCIDAALAGCSSGSSGSDGTTRTTTTTTAATTTSRPVTSAPTTCAEGAEYLKHPTDCHKYIQCDNGIPLERDCPPPLYFSVRMKRCEWTSEC